MKITTRSVERRNPHVIRLFVLQERYGFSDEFIADLFSVTIRAVDGWRKGRVPRTGAPSLLAGVQLIEEYFSGQHLATSTSWSVGSVAMQAT